MSTDKLQSIIVQTINLSSYQINSIEEKTNGVFIDIQKFNRYGYINTLRGLVRNEDDVGNLKNVLGLN